MAISGMSLGSISGSSTGMGGMDNTETVTGTFLATGLTSPIPITDGLNKDVIGFMFQSSPGEVRSVWVSSKTATELVLATSGLNTAGLVVNATLQLQ